MMKCPIEEIFGKGGLAKRICLQLLHTAYNLKQHNVTKEWRKLWNDTADTEWEDMKCPVLSFWEHVVIKRGVQQERQKRS